MRRRTLKDNGARSLHDANNVDNLSATSLTDVNAGNVQPAQTGSATKAPRPSVATNTMPSLAAGEQSEAAICVGSNYSHPLPLPHAEIHPDSLQPDPSYVGSIPSPIASHDWTEGDSSISARLEIIEGHQADIEQSQLDTEAALLQPPLHTRMSTGGDENSLPRCCDPHLHLWNDSSTVNAGEQKDRIRRVMKRYFEHLNPYYFCLNEAQFYSQFDEYARSEVQMLRSDEIMQFVALVWSIMAHMCALEMIEQESDIVPGWEYYSHALHLLTHTTDLGRGNIVTIQCLILHAGYFFCAGVAKYHAAYSVIAQAIRLTYQLGLHNQPSWHACSPFEAHMRQRIFWIVYHHDRNISQTCRVPYLIRDSEIHVDLPSRVDDERLGLSEELPEETPTSSIVSYLHELTRCSRLSSEIWDGVARVDTSKAGDVDFVTVMDAKILHFRKQLPEFLVVKPETAVAHFKSNPRPYMLWQALVLRLLTNGHRLFLRSGAGSTDTPHESHHEVCLAISKDSVDILHEFYHGLDHENYHSSVYTAFLAGLLVSLASIVLADVKSRDLRQGVAETFQKAMDLLRLLQDRSTAAKQVIKRLAKIIGLCEDAITRDRSLDPLPGPDMVIAAEPTGPSGGGTNTDLQMPASDLFMFDDFDIGSVMQTMWLPGTDPGLYELPTM
ncbi:hypothetical protein, variant 1 [Exophiala sideris]|nr:hypothetical protein, variant 1 [Exophiala sideris]